MGKFVCCAECGKKFYVDINVSLKDYVYKTAHDIFCTQKCMDKHQRKLDKAIKAKTILNIIRKERRRVVLHEQNTSEDINSGYLAGLSYIEKEIKRVMCSGT